MHPSRLLWLLILPWAASAQTPGPEPIEMRVCSPDKVLMADGEHCCPGGQQWSSSTQTCEGKVWCPGMEPGHRCMPIGPGPWRAKVSTADREFVVWQEETQELFMVAFHPDPLLPKGLRCRITLQVDITNGDILSMEVTESSGVEAFDRAARESFGLGWVPLPPKDHRQLLAKRPPSIVFTSPP